LVQVPERGQVLEQEQGQEPMQSEPELPSLQQEQRS
jgi:hypothetical protein